MSEKQIAGVMVDVTDDGFLTNADQWTREIAQEIANEEGIGELNDGHWKIIDFLRNDFKETGQVASIRRMNKVGSIATKDLYALFPEGPAKKSARVSGLAKPQGCV